MGLELFWEGSHWNWLPLTMEKWDWKWRRKGEKDSYVWRRGTSETQQAWCKGLVAIFYVRESLLDSVQRHLCFLRLQARISTGNIVRPTHQIRFFLPKGNIKLKTDFKKRQDPAYFLISSFLSLQEGVALHPALHSELCSWEPLPLTDTALQMLQLKFLSVKSFSLCIRDLPTRSPLRLF